MKNSKGILVQGSVCSILGVVASQLKFAAQFSTQCSTEPNQHRSDKPVHYKRNTRFKKK